MKIFKIIAVVFCLIGAVFYSFSLKKPHLQGIPALPVGSFYSWNLSESAARIPCVMAEIEGISFPAKLDLGYHGVLSLPKHLLEKLKNKSKPTTSLLTGIRGKTYQTSIFTIPQLYIGDLDFLNLPVEEINPEFEYDSILKRSAHYDPSDITAFIGWQAFSGTVILLDLHNSVAICCDSLETLKEHGYSLEQFVSTDFLPRKEIIEFKARVGEQGINCILDTGCSINLIHSATSIDPVEESFEFAHVDPTNPLPSMPLSIEGRALGSCVFYKTKLPLGIEAILGVDFLKTEVVCIDFIHRKLFFSPTGEKLLPCKECFESRQ